jgi:hypothetical protein
MPALALFTLSASSANRASPCPISAVSDGRRIYEKHIAERYKGFRFQVQSDAATVAERSKHNGVGSGDLLISKKLKADLPACHLSSSQMPFDGLAAKRL